MTKEGTFDEYIGVRVSTATEIFITKLSNQLGIGFSETLRMIIQKGMNQFDRINIDEDTKQILEVAKMTEQFRLSDLMIKMHLKKAFLLSNFKKLIMQLREKDISKSDRMTVALMCLRRIEHTYGKQSEQYKEAVEWSGLTNR